MSEYRAQIPHGGRWGLRATRLFDGEVFHVGAPLVVVSGGRISAVDLSGGIDWYNSTQLLYLTSYNELNTHLFLGSLACNGCYQKWNH